MSAFFSADTDGLDRFVETSGNDVSMFGATHDALRSGRAYLSGLALNGFVQHSNLDRCQELVELMDENGRFVSEISTALKDYGHPVGDGVYRADVGVVNAELAKTDTEAERASRAFALYPAEVVAVVGDNFDDIAGRAGHRDQITVHDLHEVIDDESAPSQLRDAAYRLAADQNLFNRMDVAKQTDLSAEPLGHGFNLAKADGIIGRDDVAQFRDKDYQARVLLAWHPLVETAGQGYDLSRVDSHVGEDDVAAFVEDDNIPAYVRLAVFDVYAERYGLDLTEREVLEQELAFAPGGFGGGTTYLDVTGQPGAGRLPMVSLTGEQPAGGARPAQSGGPRPGAPRGGGGGAGAAAAIYAQLLITSATFGWNQGRQAGIERDGDPQFVHVDPTTGHKTTIDPSDLADLTPGEAKAYVAYFAANGFPPPTNSSSVEPHPYLDVNGQWRMSDTNQPVHNIDRDGDTGPAPLQNPDHYYDSHGNLRWKNTNQLVADVPVRPQYRDNDGTWRWADTQEPVDAETPSDESPIFSAISQDSRLVREARRLGTSNQRSADALTAQLANGNLNPGIGTKRLFGQIFEARARDGTRVYFQNLDGRITVVAKSTKANQPRVIEILRELYG